MIKINPTRWQLAPWAHQVQGVKDLIEKPVFLLAHEMRCGKTATVINAACELCLASELEIVVVVAPAQVITVWRDSKVGEIEKHCWVSYAAGQEGKEGVTFKTKKIASDPDPSPRLTFILASLEYLRQEGGKAGIFNRVEEILSKVSGRKVWLVIDEGSALGNPTSAQTRAVLKLRQGFNRVTILDGTPAGDSTKAVYSKFKVLDKSILGYKNQREFLLHHAVWSDSTRYRRVVGYKNLELLTRKTSAFVSRVEAKDVLDMPRSVPGFITAELDTKTWDVYQRLRDEALVELESGRCLVQHAPVLVMRLAQVCAGFLGGVSSSSTSQTTQEVSSETTSALLAWFKLRLEESSNFKCVIWCRWREEIKRLCSLLTEAKLCQVEQFWGEIKGENILHPGSSFEGPGVMVCQRQAAQYGVSFAKADTNVFLSQDYSLIGRRQSEKRIEAPGVRKVSYHVDVVVTGPRGERTVTHDIRRVLLKKEDVALRTLAGWKQALEAV
jgi:hypothetical protein